MSDVNDELGMSGIEIKLVDHDIGLPTQLLPADYPSKGPHGCFWASCGLQACKEGVQCPFLAAIVLDNSVVSDFTEADILHAKGFYCLWCDTDPTTIEASADGV